MVRIGAIEFVLSLKDNFTKVLNKSKKKAKDTAKSMGNNFKKASLAVKAAWLGVGLVVVRVIKKIVTETNQADRANAKLVQQFKNVGIATKENVKEINKLASALQKQTGFSDEEIKSSAALAASYDLTFDQIKKLLPALTDLTAFTEKSTGATAQMEDTVKLMGFVLEGQIGRLKLMGITMTDVQKEMIATGTKAERLSAFLEAVKLNAGGVAEAMQRTSSGAFKVFKNSLSDMIQAIGGKVVPAFASFANIISPVFKGITNLFEKTEPIDYGKFTPTEIDIDRMRAYGVAIDKATRKIQKAIKTGDLQVLQKDLKNLNKATKESQVLYGELTPEIESSVGASNDLKTTLEELQEAQDQKDRKTREEIESISDLKGKTTEYNNALKELEFQYNAGIISQEQQDAQLKNLRSLYGGLIKDIDQYNEALEQINNSTKERIDLSNRDVELLQQRIENEIKLREEFLKTKEETGEGTGIAGTTEDIENLKNTLSDLSNEAELNSGVLEKFLGKDNKTILVIGQRMAEFNTSLANGKVERLKFINDLKEIKQLLIDNQTELTKTNALKLENKSASWDIHITVFKEVVTI